MVRLILIALLSVASPALGQPATVVATDGFTVIPGAAVQASTRATDFSYTSITALADTIKQTTNPVFGATLLHVLDVLPGGHTGARSGIVSEVRLNGPSGAASDNRNYVGGYFRGIANSGDGGTAGAERGAVFGLNAVGACQLPATYLLDCTGLEIDTGMYAGASSRYRTGLRVASFGTAKGSLLDSAITISVLGNRAVETGFKYGLSFGALDSSGNPVTDVLIGAVTDGSLPGGLVAASGIDLSAYRFTNLAMALPGGFVVRPSGTLETPVVAPTAASLPKVMFDATGNATDQKKWQWYIDTSGNLVLTTLNDAENAAVGALVFTRGPGTSIKNVLVMSPLVASGGLIGALNTPASSSAPCTAGQMSDDANYHYVCVAANTWKRVALSSF